MQLRLSERTDEKEPKDNRSRFFSSILIRPKSVVDHRGPKSRTYRSPSLDLPASDSFDELDQDASTFSPKGIDRTRSIDRGMLTVSWYEGTTTSELKKHVRKSLVRKLRLGPKFFLENIRVIDESIQPHEEIVLSPYIPDGSKFLLKFHIKDLSEKEGRTHYGAPDSPSAAPSPFPDRKEMGKLQREISDVIVSKNSRSLNRNRAASFTQSLSPVRGDLKEKELTLSSTATTDIRSEARSKDLPSPSPDNDSSQESTRSNEQYMDNDMLAERIEFLFHQKLGDVRPVLVEKRQVVFTIANYFVLFLSIIAISAEIHNRAPGWIEWVDENVSSVQDCAADRDALFECISRGDMSGLVASVILWATQSVATKSIFLFGFDSTTKLWVVVYEAGVTAICWGTSYMFIRRGLNPDTRENFLQKYWKDAVYGSLAGFNAAFLKAVLKNLIPQDQVLDVLEHPQLRIIELLSRFMMKRD